MVSESEKNKIREEIVNEAVEDAKKEEKANMYYPYACVIIGLMGLFFPAPINVFLGVVAIMLAKKSIDDGHKTMGRIGGILGMIAIISLLFGAGSLLSSFSISIIP